MAPRTYDILIDGTSIHPTLQTTFNYSFPIFKDAKMASDFVPLPPLRLHDRHIDSSLTLKSVKSLGFSMAQYLCQLCDDELAAYIRNSKEHRLRAGERFMPPEDDTLHTSQMHPYWHSLICVNVPRQRRGDEDRFRAETVLIMIQWKGLPVILPKLSLHEDVLKEIRPINENHRHIATYEMFAFCPLANKLVRDMGPVPRFKWETPLTVGPFNKDRSHRACRPDAKAGLWSRIASTYLSKASKRQHPKQRLVQSREAPKLGRVNDIVRDPGRRGPRAMRYHPEPKHYLQRAWCHAVENDATFIIFHCGKYERIGFRHRETQTLYLSELIDPSAVPMYGKMEIGLQIAIAKDLLERRAASRKEEEELARTSKKRPAEDNESDGNNKRQRTEKRPERANPSAEIIEAGLGSRDLALFRFEYGNFNSPVPSSFLRVEPSCAPSMKDRPFSQPVKGRKKHKPSEYFTLTLSEPFDHGAIGTVHRASAKFEVESTTVEYPGLAVKLGFEAEHQERLRNEYKIYQHMAKVGFTANILRVHGLFHDCETGLLALVMDYGGPTLGEVMFQKGDKKFTSQEREALWDALHGLHKANVLHGDIRTSNITVDGSDNVYFIDFDCAEIDPPPDAFEDDEDSLASILGDEIV
ncbi:hypothetical protein M413DRAFT_28113 [Hebeloma cylindrosporum]|uniref:Protein kinase domain-containing protein n=1 Tax=Hebeloma cylindrosporum TaxID=76867 RepID=A0A0C2YIZ0_HEBCY|nr:hypothetical protein M413DRAFT_28113 [Hebeloma cylindrosporum h7]